jgi:hypothetical protein
MMASVKPKSFIAATLGLWFMLGAGLASAQDSNAEDLGTVLATQQNLSMYYDLIKVSF